MSITRVFPRPFRHEGICPPIWGVQVQGTHEGDTDMGWDLILVDYIIN